MNTVRSISLFLLSYIFITNTLLLYYSLNKDFKSNYYYDLIENAKNNTVKISLNYRITYNKNPILVSKDIENLIYYIGNINRFLINKDIVTGSGFITDKGILTVDHLCEEISKLLFKKDENIENLLIKTFSSSFTDINKENFSKAFEFKKIIVIKNYNKSKLKILKNIKILKRGKKIDLCFLKNYFNPNKKFKISKKKIKYSQNIISISYLNGFFEKNILPYNKGFFIGVSKNKYYFTLQLYKGASGSPIFDTSFNLLSIIDSVYDDTNISLGSDSNTIINFLED